MLTTILVIFLVGICIYLFKVDKILGFVATVAIIGSDTDSAGIMYYIIKYIPFFKIFIRGTTLLLCTYAIVEIFKLYELGRVKRKFVFFYFIPLILTSALIVLVNIFRGEGVIFSLSEFIWLGTPIYFIWIFGSRGSDSQIFLIRILIIQAIVSIIILILGPITKDINGASYAYIIGGEIWKSLGQTVVNSKISFGSFNKQSLDVMKFAQFHNPNSLGVYATTFISIGLYLLYRFKRKKTYLLSALILIPIGIIGWFNSLTRGPIFMVGLVIIIIVLRKMIDFKMRTKLIFIFSLILIMFVFNEKILEFSSHFFLSMENISIRSRLEGYFYAFKTIFSNPLFGLPTDLKNPVPHILPLKIMTYYGILAGISISVPFIHITFETIRNFKKGMESNSTVEFLYPTFLVAIILGTLLTNGVVVYALLWILMAESTLRLNIVWKTSNQVLNSIEKSNLEFKMINLYHLINSRIKVMKGKFMKFKMKEKNHSINHSESE